MVREDRSGYLLPLNPKHTFQNAASCWDAVYDFQTSLTHALQLGLLKRGRPGWKGEERLSCFQFLLGPVQPQTGAELLRPLSSSLPHLQKTFAILLTVRITPYCALHLPGQASTYQAAPACGPRSSEAPSPCWKVAFPKTPVGPKEPRFQTPLF